MKKLLISIGVLALLFLLFLLILPPPVSSNGEQCGERGKEKKEHKEKEKEEEPQQAFNVGITIEEEVRAESGQSLNPSETGAGEFPPIWANYKRQLGFQRYATLMEGVGGVFLVWLPAEKVFCRIDRAKSKIHPWDISQIGADYSKNLRTIEDETKLLRYAQGHNCADAEVFLALPKKVENRIHARIQQWLRNRNIPLDRVAGIRAFYNEDAGSLVLHTELVALKSGESVEAPMVIPLG